MPESKAARLRAYFTRARLLELFSYCPETGHLRLLATGETITAMNNHGYVWVHVDGFCLLAHRAIWRMVTGEWPHMVDHINGTRIDNRWTNLRETNHSLNAQNQHKAMCTSSTGFLGVSVNCGRGRRAKPYRAGIQTGKRWVHIGVYATPEEAHAAYLAAKAKHHPTSFLAQQGA